MNGSKQHERGSWTNVLPLLTAAFALSQAAIADELDCNDMENVVREMLADNMQIPQYLGLRSAEAANATFKLNYFHAESKEYHRTLCSAMIKLNQESFAEAETRSAGLNEPQTRERIAVKAAAVGGLAPYVTFPEGFKILYELKLTNNGTNWLVTRLNDPPRDYICSLPDPHLYLGDSADRICRHR